MQVVTERLPEFLEMKLGENTFYIETDNPKRAQGLNEVHIGGRLLMVFQVDDIQEFVKHATANGATIAVKPVQQYWGDWSAVIADPDGNELIIDQLQK